MPHYPRVERPPAPRRPRRRAMTPRLPAPPPTRPAAPHWLDRREAEQEAIDERRLHEPAQPRRA